MSSSQISCQVHDNLPLYAPGGDCIDGDSELRLPVNVLLKR